MVLVTKGYGNLNLSFGLRAEGQVDYTETKVFIDMSETTFSFNGSPDRAAPALVQSAQASPEHGKQLGRSPEILSLEDGNEGFMVIEEEIVLRPTPSQNTPGTDSAVISKGSEHENSGKALSSKDSIAGPRG